MPLLARAFPSVEYAEKRAYPERRLNSNGKSEETRLVHTKVANPAPDIRRCGDGTMTSPRKNNSTSHIHPFNTELLPKPILFYPDCSNCHCAGSICRTPCGRRLPHPVAYPRGSPSDGSQTPHSKQQIRSSCPWATGTWTCVSIKRQIR